MYDLHLIHQIPSNTLWHKRETSKKIKSQLEENELRGEHRVYVSLPDPQAHSNHLSEQVANTLFPLKTFTLIIFRNFALSQHK